MHLNDILVYRLGIYDEEGNFIATIDHKNDLHVLELFHKNLKTGYGLYVRPNMEHDLKFIGSYNDEGIARNVKNSIAKGLIAGAEYFRAPENESEECRNRCHICRKPSDKYVKICNAKYHLCDTHFKDFQNATKLIMEGGTDHADTNDCHNSRHNNTTPKS